MGRFILQRLLYAIPIVLLVPLFVFLLMDLAPGDAAQAVAGELATPEQVQAVRERLHLDDPVIVRYLQWLGGAIHGDFGNSLLVPHPQVASMVARTLPITVSLALLSIVLSIVVGILSGVIAALRSNKLADRLISVVSSTAIAVPSFWLALILVLVFAVNLEWLPALGYVPLGVDPGQWFVHLLLPAISLAALPAAEMARQTRAALVDELQLNYVLAARARGFSTDVIVWKHALKNAAVPVVTVLGFRLAQVFGIAAIIETVFSLNGTGQLLITAATSRDVPTVLGIVVLMTVTIVVINLLVDISYGYFNPRIRAGRS